MTVPREKPIAPSERGAHIPEATREAIRGLMFEHGQNMEHLLWATTMLRYSAAKKIADSIAGQAATARKKNAKILPETFLEHQEELRRAAEMLSNASSRQDDKALALAYGLLTASCVRCHSTYLWER